MFSARAEVRNPNDVELSITMTGTVEDWKRIAAKMNTNAYPDWQFASVIRQAIDGTVGHVEKAYEVQV